MAPAGREAQPSSDPSARSHIVKAVEASGLGTSLAAAEEWRLGDDSATINEATIIPKKRNMDLPSGQGQQAPQGDARDRTGRAARNE